MPLKRNPDLSSKDEQRTTQSVFKVWTFYPNASKCTLFIKCTHFDITCSLLPSSKWKGILSTFFASL